VKQNSIVIAALAVSLSFCAKADNWSFELEPYLMGTSIVGDASIGRVSGAPIDVDFKTILDNLDMAAMIHFEAHHKSGWGLAMDYGFMDLSQKKSNNRDGFVKVGLRQGVLETLGLYRVKYGRATVDYFAGVRWWDNDIELMLDPAIVGGSINIKVKEDWLDMVVGLRWNHQINRQWNFITRADIGGFGLSSDFTSTVEAGFTYKISKLMTIDMKYKASWVDYENDGNEVEVGYFVYDTITHGPILGLNFNF
jgi:hypothetical protein